MIDTKHSGMSERPRQDGADSAKMADLSKGEAQFGWMFIVSRELRLLTQ